MSGALLLNASYEILTIVGSRRALILVLTDHAEMLEEHPTKDPAVSTGGLVVPYPSVIRLKKQSVWNVNRSKKTPPLTRKRVFTRDKYTCQVVGCNSKDVTIDHVFPRSQGGKNTWENLVSMCEEHNRKKADRSLEAMGWKLKKEPQAPKGFMLSVPATRPEWEQYIAWNKDKVLV